MPRKLRDKFVVWVIIMLIIGRFFASGEWISNVVLFGFIMALATLFVDFLNLKELAVFEQRKKDRRRNAYFLFILVLVIVSSILTLSVIDIICISDRVSDTFTLLTLLISLTQKTILDSVVKYINK